MSRRSFSQDYKIETVRQIASRGISASQAAREVGIRQNVLSRWIKEFKAAVADKPLTGKAGRRGRGRPNVAAVGRRQGDGSASLGAASSVSNGELTEVQRLRRELHRITSERDTLKKAIVYLARDGQQPAA